MHMAQLFSYSFESAHQVSGHLFIVQEEKSMENFYLQIWGNRKCTLQINAYDESYNKLHVQSANVYAR